MGLYKGEISGTGALTIYTDEVVNVTFTVNSDGELIVNEPNDYNGAVFTREGNDLIVTFTDNIVNVDIERVENYITVEPKGVSAERINEITADDVATLRHYIIGWESGVISCGEKVNTNEVVDVTFSINDDGELIANEPDNYQGTIFTRDGNDLIATPMDNVANVNIKRIENYLITEGGVYE